MCLRKGKKFRSSQGGKVGRNIYSVLSIKVIASLLAFKNVQSLTVEDSLESRRSLYQLTFTLNIILKSTKFLFVRICPIMLGI